MKFSGAPRPRPPATMMSASSIDGPLDCSCSLVDDLRAERVRPRSSAVTSTISGSPPSPRRGVERAGAEEREPRRRLPADVDENRVLQRGTLADERAVARLEVDEIPVEPGVEPRCEPGGDVGREHRVREQHRVVAAVLRRPSRARRRAPAAAAARASRPRRRAPSPRRTSPPRARAPSRRRR